MGFNYDTGADVLGAVDAALDDVLSDDQDVGYMDAIDFLGAGLPQRALLIRVKNVPQVVASKGTIAQTLQSYAPDTIDQKVYSEMAKQFSQKLREQGVDPDVQVIDTANMRFANESPVWRVTTLGILGAGVLGAAWHFFMRRK